MQDDKRRLPVIQPEPVRFDRRLALMVGGVSFVMACGGNNGGPDADASATDAVDGAMDESVPPDAMDDNTGDSGEAGDTGPVCRGRDVGTVDMFPVGTRMAIGATGLFVGRDARGLWALELICPHFGGQIQARTDGMLYCLQQPSADHGSIYDADGNKLVGPEPPAGRSPNLTNRAVSICDGHVFVDRTREVALGTRLAVP